MSGSRISEQFLSVSMDKVYRDLSVEPVIPYNSCKRLHYVVETLVTA